MAKKDFYVDIDLHGSEIQNFAIENIPDIESMDPPLKGTNGRTIFNKRDGHLYTYIIDTENPNGKWVKQAQYKDIKEGVEEAIAEDETIQERINQMIEDNPVIAELEESKLDKIDEAGKIYGTDYERDPVTGEPVIDPETGEPIVIQVPYNVSSFLDTTSDQTIGGNKTFTGETSFTNTANFSGVTNFTNASNFSGESSFTNNANFTNTANFSGVTNFSNTANFTNASNFSGESSFTNNVTYSDGTVSFGTDEHHIANVDFTYANVTAVTQTQGDSSTNIATTAYVDTAISNLDEEKLDKISTANRVYGTDENGNQTSYDVDSFGAVDDVQVNGTSVVSNKVANITLNIKKLSSAESGYFASYILEDSNNNQFGDTINIPKDFLVKDASLKICETSGVPATQPPLEKGDPYLDFEINVEDKSEEEQHLYINVKTLVDTYTGSTYIDITNNTVSLKYGDLKTQLTSDLQDTFYTETEVDTIAATKVDKEVQGTNGKALIFNEVDGGGAKFEHNDGLESFVGVNDGGENGLAAQIYADKLVNGKWQGAKLDVTNGGMYYTVGSESFANRAVAANEIATKGDITSAISNTKQVVLCPTIPAENNEYTWEITNNIGSDAVVTLYKKDEQNRFVEVMADFTVTSSLIIIKMYESEDLPRVSAGDFKAVILG